MMSSVVPFSRFNRPRTVSVPFGDGMDSVYEERIVNGRKTLVEVEKRPISPMIQEALQDTLIYNILARYQRGDVSALNKVNLQYMDVVGMPTTLAEAQQQLINVSRQFESLPLDVRRKFNNNVNEFVQEMSNGNVVEVLRTFGYDVPDQTSVSSPTPSSVEKGSDD